MKKATEAAWFTAGAAGGALLLLGHSVWWAVLSYALEGHGNTPGVLRFHDWRTPGGLGSILATQAGSIFGLPEIFCGALLGSASVLAWRRRGRLSPREEAFCRQVAWLMIVPVAAWNVLGLIVGLLSSASPARAEAVQVLGALLSLKMLWGVGLVVHLLRDHKAGTAST